MNDLDRHELLDIDHVILAELVHARERLDMEPTVLREAARQRRPIRQHFSRAAVVLVLVGTGAAIVNKTLLTPERWIVAQEEPSLTINARTIAAIDAAADRILHAQINQRIDSPEDCVIDEWLSPAHPVAGQTLHQRYRIICDGRLLQDLEAILTLEAPSLRSGDELRERLFRASEEISDQMGTENWWSSGESIGIDRMAKTWWSSDRYTHDLNIPAGSPTHLREELANGNYAVAGRETRDGRELIELRRSFTNDSGGVAERSLWVDAETYLPVQSVETYIHTPGSKPVHSTEITFVFEDPSATTADFSPVPPDGYIELDEPVESGG